jgi:hypothetical protein
MEGDAMLRILKPFVPVAMVIGIAGGLVVSLGGSDAGATSKGITCPDTTAGIIEHTYTIVCSGQTAAEATVTITSVKSTSLGVTVVGAKTATFGGVNGSFNSTDATVQMTFGLDGQTQTVTITVMQLGGTPRGILLNPSTSTATSFTDWWIHS